MVLRGLLPYQRHHSQEPLYAGGRELKFRRETSVTIVHRSSSVIRVRRQILSALALMVTALEFPLHAQDTPEFKTVVNVSNPISQVSRLDLSRIFLKKELRWPNGLMIAAADQALDSPTRESFSQEVHRKSSQAVENYWRKLLFSGKGTPPLKLDSDEEVLDFVRGNVGAIGYVAGDAEVGDGVKVLTVTP
jgi:hypothetical protein